MREPNPNLQPLLFPDFLCDEHAGFLLHQCETQLSWCEESIQMFGKRHRVPRRVGWCGEDGVNYRYAGRDHPGVGWPAFCRELVARLIDFAGDAFEQPSLNHMIANRYGSGDDYMGWHRDNERDVIGPVWVVSLGAVRPFRWRLAKQGPSQLVSLPHGSLMRLPGTLYHALPKRPAIQAPRVSLTLRYIYAG